ncbi:MAG: hypothetical protein ACRECH_06490 [Nitrososphaerales archaeon]
MTYISGIVLTGTNLSSPINKWASSPAPDNFVNMQSINQGSPLRILAVPVGILTNFTFYPITQSGTVHIATNQTYDFVINFADGQAATGLVNAQ